MKTELLAPAKDKYTAFAAIDCGADAVYIGASCFGARQNAQNSIEDIKEVIEYAHKYRSKVFVTVNTILTEEELETAVKLVKQLDIIGADAILVQDMGLLNRLIELVNSGLITIPIHMSTQCDNRLMEKVKFFNDIGVSRVVLARELSIKKIKEIHECCPNLELEFFVHGALCVSYSGQCYLSQFIGGRSANRGKCAQPCRKKYSVVNEKGEFLLKDKHALCLKDFNASEYLKDLIDAGIISFKIEGRLKDIGYVKNVVSYYRQKLDKISDKISSGTCEYNYIPDLEKSFNRGFTDYFLEERKDCYNFISSKSKGKYLGKLIGLKNDYLLIETSQQISPQDGLCYESENDIFGFLVNRVQRIDKKTVKVYPNKYHKIKTGQLIYRNQDTVFEKQLQLPVSRKIGVNITVAKNKIVLSDEDNNSIMLELQKGEIPKNQSKMNETFIKQFKKSGDSIFKINTIKLEDNIAFLPISEINSIRRKALELLKNKRLENYTRDIQKPMHTVQYFQKEVDYRANVYNSEAKRFYEACNCKVKEPAIEKQFPEREIELMRTKHCIKYALGICKTKENLFLADEKGVKFPLKFDCKNCEMIILSPQKL